MFIDDDTCFACGGRNESGLKLRFASDGADHAVRAETVLDARFQGWRGFAHGGILSTLIDDAMAHAGVAAGYFGFMARVDVRFRHPAPIGAPLIVRAWVTWRRRDVFGVEAEVLGADGTVYTTAEGKFVGKEPCRA